MKKLTWPIGLALFLSAGSAQAGIHVGIEIGLPPVPELVVVAPGVQVVAGFQDEVFLQGGWYWCRRDGGWFRAHGPHDHFDWVDQRRVPGALSRMPAGRYHNWHGEGFHGGRGHDGPRGGQERMHVDNRGHEGRGREGHEGRQEHEEGHRH